MEYVELLNLKGNERIAMYLRLRILSQVKLADNTKFAMHLHPLAEFYKYPDGVGKGVAWLNVEAKLLNLLKKLGIVREWGFTADPTYFGYHSQVWILINNNKAKKAFDLVSFMFLSDNLQKVD